MILQYLTNISWVKPYQNEFLDVFFKAFPYFASDIAYFLIIAFGFWYSNSKFFRDLGIYVCLSTILNTLLKAIFAIPRPTPLIAIDPYGFPSGDVQVAFGFWLLLCNFYKQRWLYLTAAFILINMAISRIYLGFHTPLDVFGGFAFGYITAKLFNILANSNFYQDSLTKNYKAAALTSASLIILYLALYKLDYINKMNIVAGGTLLGITLASSTKFIQTKPIKKIPILLLGLAGLFSVRTILLMILPQSLRSIFIIGFALGAYLMLMPYLAERASNILKRAKVRAE